MSTIDSGYVLAAEIRIEHEAALIAAVLVCSARKSNASLRMSASMNGAGEGIVPAACLRNRSCLRLTGQRGGLVVGAVSQLIGRLKGRSDAFTGTRPLLVGGQELHPDTRGLSGAALLFA